MDSNMIENNSELPEYFKEPLTSNTNGDSKVSAERNGEESSRSSSWEKFAIDKPVAMMIGSRRRPLAYNGLDFGNIGVVNLCFHRKKTWKLFQ